MKAELTTVLQVDVGKVMMSENTRYAAGHDSLAADRTSWLLTLTWAPRMLLSCASSQLLLAGQGALQPFTYLCMSCCTLQARGPSSVTDCCPCALPQPTSRLLMAADRLRGTLQTR